MVSTEVREDEQDLKKPSRDLLIALVDKITKENLHPETDWGKAVGKERFWETDENTEGQLHAG